MKYSGSCLCGSIRYQAQNLLPNMAHCHCSMCRKFHGAAMSTFAACASTDFKWLSGKELLQSFKAENGSTRQFCRQCGSSLIFASADADGSVIEFTLGTLDSPLEHKPDAHIFVAHKADWFDTSDTLTKYADGRNGPPLSNE